MTRAFKFNVNNCLIHMRINFPNEVFPNSLSDDFNERETKKKIYILLTHRKVFDKANFHARIYVNANFHVFFFLNVHGAQRKCEQCELRRHLLWHRFQSPPRFDTDDHHSVAYLNINLWLFVIQSI